MNGNVIYRKKKYVIIKIKNNAFIIYNLRKPFEQGHSHINNYFIAKTIIEYCINGIENKTISRLLKKPYIQETLKRIK